MDDKHWQKSLAAFILFGSLEQDIGYVAFQPQRHQTNKQILVCQREDIIISPIISFFFPKQCDCGHTMPHWGVLTVRVKAPCSIEGVSGASGIFPVNFNAKWLFVTCPCAFRLRSLAQNDGRGISVRRFSCNFPHKMALVKCPCAFDCAGSHKTRVEGLAVQHFSSKFPHKSS